MLGLVPERMSAHRSEREADGHARGDVEAQVPPRCDADEHGCTDEVEGQTRRIRLGFETGPGNASREAANRRDHSEGYHALWVRVQRCGCRTDHESAPDGAAHVGRNPQVVEDVPTRSSLSRFA